MLESNLEALVDNLLSAYGVGLPQSQLRRFGKSPFRPDFIARGLGGSRTAIQVRQADVDARALYVLYVWHDEARTRKAIDQLLLVTPEPPSDEDVQRFEKAFDGDNTAQWIGIKQLPELLGITDDIDFESPQERDRLQTASLIRRTREYRNDVIGVGGVVEERAAERDELGRGSHHIARVLFRRLRIPPDGQHGVADELVQNPAVRPDDLPRAAIVVTHHLLDELRVADADECRE